MTIPKINSAHGSDTRNIINRVIEVLNQHGVSIQDLVAKGQLTPAQYATLIQSINGLVSKGNVGLNDLTTEVLTAIEGGEGAEFNLLSIPRNKSVTPEKTTFIEVTSNNLLNKHNFLANSWLDAWGNIVGYPSGNLSHFIPIKPNAKYTIFGAFRYAYYTEDDEFISLHDSVETQTIDTLSNAHYLRVMYVHSRKDTVKVNEGSVALPYDEYAISLIGQEQLDMDDLWGSIKKEVEKLIVENIEKNSFVSVSHVDTFLDGKTTATGHYYGKTGGSLITSVPLDVGSKSRKTIRIKNNYNRIITFNVHARKTAEAGSDLLREIIFDDIHTLPINPGEERFFDSTEYPILETAFQGLVVRIGMSSGTTMSGNAELDIMAGV